MRDEKWYDLIEKIQTKASEFSEKRVEAEFPHNNIGIRHTVLFTVAGNKYKLIRDSKPAVEGEKKVFNQRNRTAEKVFIFSKTEKSHVVSLFKYDAVTRDWLEVEWRDMFR